MPLGKMKKDIILNYDAFIRSIKRNIDSPLIFLLGAGASISSGIKSAQDCIWDWKRDILITKNPNTSELYKNLKEDSVKQAIQRWLDNEGIYPRLNDPDEYSFYAEKAYPIADDRRKYFQSLFNQKEPYVGYKLLCLLNSAGIVKSIWSTNFDGLVVKAAYQMNLTPIEITLDSADRIHRNESKNELLYIALHGDYKYDLLKNTNNELDTQNDLFISTLTRYLIDKNLVVCGYSGRDKSLMEALKNAYSQKGTGRLYWCGYGHLVNSTINELINIAKDIGREAYYIPTDGFDKTIIHLSKACFEEEETRLNEINKLLKVADDTLVKNTPFSIENPQVDKYLKSNLHPIKFPKEVFQFEIEYKDGEKPWNTLRDLTKNYDICAVPFKQKVYAISTKSLISKAFNGKLKSDIVRVPISIDDIQNVSAFQNLFLSAILMGISKLRNLETDKKYRLWDNKADSVFEQNDIQIEIHKAISLSLFFKKNANYGFLTFKPSIWLKSDADISKEIKQRTSKNFLEKLFNLQYDEYLENWIANIFADNAKLNFEFPLDSGSALDFSISKSTSFSQIFVPNHPSKYFPKNFDKKLLIHKGIQYLEPQLSFTNKNTSKISKDFHPMRGLVQHRPYDYPLMGKVFSNQIDIGVICPSKYSQHFYDFLNKINLKHKPNVNPDYLIEYPGFSSAYNVPINIPVMEDGKWLDNTFNTNSSDLKENSLKLARQITAKIDQLVNSNSQLVITIFIPTEWQLYRSYIEEYEYFDLHDYIKAFAATKGVATQLIEEDTLSESLLCQKFWWLSLAFYVKSLRSPWILANTDNKTAFAGIGYSIKRNKDDTEIVLGCSHIYNSEGQGLKYKLSKVDDFILDKQKNPYLSYNDAFQLGISIRELFLTSMDYLPQRVVIHKRTHFKIDEKNGLIDSLSMAGINNIDLIEINYEPDVRFFSTNIYNNQLQIDKFPISRCTCIQIDDFTALLWTHGIVPSIRNEHFKYYLGGRSIPSPLKITKHYGQSDLSTIANEILGLTKMNWNSFDLYTKLPATLNSSNEISRIGKLLSRFEGRMYDYRFFI